MLQSNVLLRDVLPIARTHTDGAVAGHVKAELSSRLELDGVPVDTVDAFCQAFEVFSRALISASIPTIYGPEFAETLASILFGRDPLLTLLSPQLPNRRILIVGERGTGKESVARVLSAGLAAFGGGRPVVAVNAAALPDTLLESTLFGHVRGAFTGATRARTGLMSELHPGGVLFFDEAGEASPALQAKLLRVFQTGEYAPVGAPEAPSRADYHVVAATNAPLEALQLGTAMRADLFDRLAAPLIELPPLRTLLHDQTRGRAIFQCLAMGVIRELGATGRTGAGTPSVVRRAGDRREINFELWATPRAARIARSVQEGTQGYPWPGNLREAAQRIRQTLFVGSAALKSPNHRAASTAPKPPANAIALTVPESGTLKTQLEAAERQLYARAATQHESIIAVADALGVARQTASRRLSYFEIPAPGSSTDTPTSTPHATVPMPTRRPLGTPNATNHPGSDAMGHRPPDASVSAAVFSPFTAPRISRRLLAIMERSAPQPENLTAAVREHAKALRAAIGEYPFVDLQLVSAIEHTLLELINDILPSHSEPHVRLVAAAVAYFVEVDDEDHDLSSAIGLDDDVRVVNEVARVLGRDDLEIRVE